MHFIFKLNFVVLTIVVAILVYKYALPYYNHVHLHQLTKEVYESITESEVPWKVYASSEQGRNIYYWQSADSGETTLIFGAFHGDEQAGFHLVKQLADTLLAHPDWIRKRAVLVPVLNPDGLLKRTRVNSRGVDINRNFPTDDWSPVYNKERYYPGHEAGSEKETRIAMQMIERFKPRQIISIHDALEMNNYNGPALKLAELLEKYNGYPVTADVGYPTPGSFGNYGGTERKIPLVTLELPDIDPEEAWEQNSKALIEAINFDY